MGYSSTSISTTEQCRTAFPSTSTSTSHRSQFPVRWCRLWISVAAIANDRVDADLLTRHSRRSTSSEASGSESRRRCVSFFSIFLFFIFFFGWSPLFAFLLSLFFLLSSFHFFVCVCVRASLLLPLLLGCRPTSHFPLRGFSKKTPRRLWQSRHVRPHPSLTPTLLFDDSFDDTSTRAAVQQQQQRSSNSSSSSRSSRSNK